MKEILSQKRRVPEAGDSAGKRFQRVMLKEGVAESLYIATLQYFEKVLFKGKEILITSEAELRSYLALDDFYTSSLFGNIVLE